MISENSWGPEHVSKFQVILKINAFASKPVTETGEMLIHWREFWSHYNNASDKSNLQSDWSGATVSDGDWKGSVT